MVDCVLYYIVEESISNVEEMLSLDESLAVMLLNYVGDVIEDYDKVVEPLDGMRSCFYSKNPKKLDLDLTNRGNYTNKALN